MSKVSIFMTAGWIGLAGAGVAIAGAFAPDGDGIALTGAIVAVLGCWAMLFTRKADEYTQALWTAAASLAFATLLILFILMPFAEGVYDGFTMAHEGLDPGTDPAKSEPESSMGLTIMSAIFAFYVGLFWKRLRST